jgi:isocitrate dehydrogenase
LTKTSKFTQRCRRLSKTKVCGLHNTQACTQSPKPKQRTKQLTKHVKPLKQKPTQHTEAPPTPVKLSVSFASTVADQAKAYLQQNRDNNIVFVVKQNIGKQTEHAAFAYTRQEVAHDMKKSSLVSRPPQLTKPHKVSLYLRGNTNALVVDVVSLVAALKGKSPIIVLHADADVYVARNAAQDTKLHEFKVNHVTAAAAPLQATRPKA